MLSDAGGPESCDLDHPKRVEDCLPEVVFRGGWGGVVVWLAWVAWVAMLTYINQAIIKSIIDLQFIMG